MNDMVKILGCSAMTVTRAFRQLEETGLFETGKTGVQKYLKGTEERNVILQQLEDALSTPVAETVFISKRNWKRNRYFRAFPFGQFGTYPYRKRRGRRSSVLCSE